jgi:voltage-gated potassium channel
MHFRERLYRIIDENNKETLAARLFDQALATLILLNVVLIVLESHQSLWDRYSSWFLSFEYFSVGIFTLEYLVRLITADLKYPGFTKGRACIRYIFSTLAIIDLLAVLPAYLPMFFAVDMRVIRVLRLMRIARLFKLGRYTKALHLISVVVQEKRSELFTTAFLAGLLLVVSSTLMYYMERDIQPDAFPNIVATLWWAICTLTTVGYGDVVPVTAGGKIISSIIAILGIGLVALPAGILSASFMDKLKSTPGKQKCPHCGEEF